MLDNRIALFSGNYCTVVDLTDDLIIKEYVTEIFTVIEIIDLTDLKESAVL
jgi:hypothetical protein